MPSSKVTQGRAIMAAVIDRPASIPKPLPTVTASSSPVRARRAVVHNCGPAWPDCSNCPRVAKVVRGSGKISSP